MNIKFSKMHGLGNDFVVIDAINQSINLTAEQVRFMANRHFGVGCDQLLLVEKPRSPEAEFGYRIFNADGGEVEQCGNGARCFARFVVDQQLTKNTEITVETKSGIIVLVLEDNGDVTVNMGVPNFAPDSLPFSASAQATEYDLDTRDGTVKIAAVSMGNPHAVLTVADVGTAHVDVLGAEIENHRRFPERVNVGFMQIISKDAIRLRVYERGAGETLACGTGACAAVAAGISQGKLAECVKVSLPGGELVIRWGAENENLFMSGPATYVFEGNISL
ncbi:Diaminopimelate epimerase [hydrothermal vent metagenome]|uniref:diaminopimelate epimerase n=1 Tax=hydrothermal vent metagenome TaxID=652676 RepID=A0A3B0XT14_9ZZZZ